MLFVKGSNINYYVGNLNKFLQDSSYKKTNKLIYDTSIAIFLQNTSFSIWSYLII